MPVPKTMQRLSATTSPKKSRSSTQQKSKHVPNEDEEDIYKEPVKNIIRPLNQLLLTEDKLTEELTRVLTATDPNVPNNTVKFNYKEKCYKLDPEGPMEHLAFHFQMNGSSLHVESDEAEQQRVFDDHLADRASQLQRQLASEAAELGEADMDLKLIKSGKSAFNYSERAAQTLHPCMRSRGVETAPPSVVSFSSAVSQWDIYDTYMQNHRDSKLAEDQRKDIDTSDGLESDGVSPRAGNDKREGLGLVASDVVHSRPMRDALRVLERMSTQNAQDEVFQDYRYWEDASDAFRGGLGSLLPLWRFSSDRCRKKHVTALCPNPRYSDLFSVAYGSLDYLQQTSGAVCCYSLKNTTHPEHCFLLDSGAMCLDFHPLYPYLLAVGCYDGSVLVFDVRLPSKKPLYSSSIRSGRHTDPVWQVQWRGMEGGGGPSDLSFCSVSSDGRVASWTFGRGELRMEPVMQLPLVRLTTDNSAVVGAGSGAVGTLTVTLGEEPCFSGVAGGCCMHFSPHADNQSQFLVGTEEGRVHRCSTAISGQYLSTHSAHHMPVYSVQWSPFHPHVFASCSADWHVHIWEVESSAPVMSFDLGTAVGDVAWSPHSATTFAAVTSDGKVRVYDLSVNRLEPLCEQQLAKRARLTRVCFGRTNSAGGQGGQSALLLVGDDRGGVSCLKLSPNLRTNTLADPIPQSLMSTAGMEATELTAEQWQRSRLEAILQAARI